MLYDRQKCLLALVNTLGDNVSNMDFQKLLFLYCTEFENKPSYEFVPYRFGSFSFTSYADKRRLIERCLLVDQEKGWKLTHTGKVAGNVLPATQQQMLQFAREHVGLRGDALVAETYRRHPYYAIRSEMAARLLASDRRALAAVKSARPTKRSAAVCTIGYEGRSLESYLNVLIQNAITVLCDVRRNPLSRKYGFSKGTLAKGCEGVGIRYVHVPELGIASEYRRNLDSQADYDALFEYYVREALPQQSIHLERIKHWVADGERVALTCFERLPQQCHRSCVANAMNKKFGREFMPEHL
jgi:Protein of unknown function, DUF488